MESILEQWKPVLGYEGLYEVSDQGRIRSLPGKRWNGQAMHFFKGRILKAQSKSKYKHVTLSKNGTVKNIRIHQIVANAFLPPCPGTHGKVRGCYHIDHINNDTYDNRALNLQWLSHYENTYVKPGRNRDGLGRFTQ
jgi:hypothetical protein